MRIEITDTDGDGLAVYTDGGNGTVEIDNLHSGHWVASYTPQQALDLAKALIAAVKEVTGR